MRFTLDDAPFAGRTGRGVTVALLDSGVYGDHPHVGGVRGGKSFLAESEPSDFADRVGHGTAVAAAIREKGPGVELIAARIFDRQLATSVDVLVRAIQWAADEGAQLINLSLGTTNPAHAEKLAPAVAYAAERGGLVVSAREWNGSAWLPGSLAGVLGVVADAELDRDAIEVTPAESGLPRYAAAPFPRPIPNVPRERNLSGVSFAVANVTGFLARATEACGDPFRAATIG
ncbi:MAG: S8 family serine peptidase [Gemmatimonadaceae bacterium]